MSEEDIYSYRLLPWMSKSTILGYRFCSHLFKLRYIDGIHVDVGIKAQTGTNMHVKYAQFFDNINYEDLQALPIDYSQHLQDTDIYKYFYRVVMESIPLESRDFDTYKLLVANFCLIETDHWIGLNKLYHENKAKVMKYFKPVFLEEYIECEPLMIFGTIDRKDNFIGEENIQIIYDYKTGYVPKDVREYGDYQSKPFGWKLNTKKSFELHFYCVLEMTRRGFTIDPEIIDYCTNDKYFYDGSKFPDVKSYFYKTDGTPADPKDYLRLGIIYTGDQSGPYVPKKIPNSRSIRTVFEWINNIRTIIKNNGPYLKEPNFWKCRECNEQIRDECLTDIEKDMIFWASEENGEEHQPE